MDFKQVCLVCIYCMSTCISLRLRTSFNKRLNSGIVKSTDNFVWKTQPCSYLEPENVTGVQKTWGVYGSFKYKYQELSNGTLVPPPIGMRSGVPLGGISTGSIELRSDGSFHEWTIMNQHPAGAAKIQTFEDAFFGVRVANKGGLNKNGPLLFESRAVSMLIRTHPPNDLPAVESLKYTGFYPIAILEVVDSRLPVNITIQAVSAYSIGNMNRSATPAIAFFIEVYNPSKTESYDVSIMLNMPLGIEKNQQRTDVQHSNEKDTFFYERGFGQHRSPHEIFDQESQHANTGKRYRRQAVQTDLECMQLCEEIDPCQSWTYFENEQSCAIFTSTNLNAYNKDASSGIKGKWHVNDNGNTHCLTQNRPGFRAPSGNMSICANATYGNVDVSFGMSNDITKLWKEFASVGHFHNMLSEAGAYVNGAAAAAITVGPQTTNGALMYFSWYFPYRDFGIKVFGNWYKHLFSSSEDVVRSLESDGLTMLMNISGLHDAFLKPYQTDSVHTLPVWLTDVLVNSLSHIRSALWFADGRWRQWEANDCTNIDSVHNDGERHIPYIHFFPESTKNKMLAWAKYQHEDGMISEQLLYGCGRTFYSQDTLDEPGGRVMSDVSSMFMVYLYEMYRWANDTDLLQLLYPNAKKAGRWHINVCKKFGIPVKMVNTYDVLQQNQYDLCSYNGAFHLLALRVGIELGKIMDDKEFVLECEQAFEIGQLAMDKYLWNDTQSYYNSYLNDTSFPEKNPGTLMTDTFYSQILADSLGLGPLVNKTRLSMHLDAELKINDSPYGMLVQTGRYPYPGPPTDNAVWMMGNPNWASTKIRLGHNVQHAFNVAKKSLDNYRTKINDLWNVAGITGGIGYKAEGQPYTTSHYGYFMSSWHLIFAITGQQVNLPEDSITFDPKTPTPYSYPIMIPGAAGYLTGSKQGIHDYYTLTVTIGHLHVSYLSVSGYTYPGTVDLWDGQSISWKQTK